ncbi:MAG: hypothetical protein KME25_32430 [Symplocastrum torsivum CPER-KK1]|jgi:hypothetical protein|uniref:Uncharacterized protein n=1 Tax=Symplocastrum torsivum CPER-KK1 TaxID=450513 RepID=A0A951UER7_9CYAN|nr:hypothetical protein [Symplocastrum torsivum CPER-KK1]
MSIARPAHASTPSGITERKAIYQQALDDFAMTDLLAQLQKISSADFDSQPITQPESELIAALLVQQLAKNLDSQLVTAYFKAIRRGNQEVVPEPIGLEYPKSTGLPADFPTSAPAPRFTYGDRQRLCPISVNGETETETDTGRCIGSYYAYAPHHCEWMWKYVIWLDKESVSASWCIATTAWEDELEPVIQEDSLS